MNVSAVNKNDLLIVDNAILNYNFDSGAPVLQEVKLSSADVYGISADNSNFYVLSQAPNQSGRVDFYAWQKTEDSWVHEAQYKLSSYYPANALKSFNKHK